MTAETLVVVDVQKDFVEGGALGVEGGLAVAKRIEELDFSKFDRVIASRDFHEPHSDNGGHFADEPDYAGTWPAHCVQGTPGSEYALKLPPGTVHVVKGMGEPAYSVLEGRTDNGPFINAPAGMLFHEKQLVTVVGIATDYCVLETVKDLAPLVHSVLVDLSMCAGVDPATSAAAVGEMSAIENVLVVDR